MKVFYILIVALFFNIIAVGIELYQNNAGWLLYLNLIGSAAFGYALNDMFQTRRKLKKQR